VSAAGEPYVYDTRTHDALFYRTSAAGVVFVSTAAKLQSPLGCLALIAPFLPDAALLHQGRIRCSECIPRHWLQSSLQRRVSELALGLRKPETLHVEMDVTLEASGLCISSQVVRRSSARTRVLAAGHVRIDTLGVAELAFESSVQGFRTHFARGDFKSFPASERTVY
jgi:hypothetical protein